MKKRFIITGAGGHLGSTLVRMLEKQDVELRGLLLLTEQGIAPERVCYIRGDVRDRESLRPLFADGEGREVYVIHTAGLIDIGERVSPQIYEVNVNGTRNVLSLCREYGVKRLVYVSSVHAIPIKDPLAVLTETDTFSADAVVGGYAKTKAAATKAVLAAAAQGLDAVVVHPSGILGPFGRTENHLVQLVTDYIEGRLPACVNGGYDFVDVRDVARGCLLAAEKGRAGQCYILSNRHYEVKDLLRLVKREAGGRELPVLPMWMAKMAAPLIQWDAARRNRRPLYTAYSLYTLASNDRFSHDKATRELGYCPRGLEETVRDTVRWYRQERAAHALCSPRMRRGKKD